ncbi:MarR family transcriptional regulator [Guggenheimella bovis]
MSKQINEIELFKRFLNLTSLMKKAIFAPEVTREFTISRKQLYAMSVLNERGQMNMTQLAQGVGVSNQQLTKIVDVLVQKGMIQRSYNPNNRRVVLVHLTDEGVNYITRMTERIIEVVKSRGINTDERSMQRLYDNIEYMENFVSKLVR